MRVDQLRLVGVAGTNKVMAGELSRLVRRAYTDVRLAPPAKHGASSLTYAFDPRVAAVAVSYQRTAARVLWDLCISDAVRLEPLYEDLKRSLIGDTRSWCRDGTRISVSAYGVQDFAAGERQIVGVVKNALVDAAAASGVRLHVDPERPDVVFGVRLVEAQIVVSIDLAGRPMNQRGYRVAAGPAPLREDLAAVLVMLARHDGRVEAVVDPMAGAATIPIEVAGLSSGSPLWVGRSPAAHRLTEVAPHLDGLGRALFGDTRPPILASDVEVDAVRHARENVERAGLSEQIAVSHSDVRALSVDGIIRDVRARGYATDHGLILTNPPYGERLAPPDLVRLYRDLRAFCAAFPGWRAAFLVANPEFEVVFGRPRIRKPLSNGPLRGYFYLYDL